MENYQPFIFTILHIIIIFIYKNIDYKKSNFGKNFSLKFFSQLKKIIKLINIKLILIFLSYPSKIKLI